MSEFIKKCRSDDIFGLSAKCAYYLLFAFFPVVIVVFNALAAFDLSVNRFTFPAFVNEMIDTVNIPIISFSVLIFPMYRGIRAIVIGIKKIYGVKMRFRDLYIGGLLAIFCWVIVTFGFNVYIKYFCNYEIIYGQIGTFLGFALWLYLIALTVFFSAEINALRIRKRQDLTPK